MTAVSPSRSALDKRTFIDKLKTAPITPVPAMRLRYLPLLMIYYAYGALGVLSENSIRPGFGS
jgi:hypothetical protein